MADNMKIGILYKTTDAPWGGINSFFRNFIRSGKQSNKVELIEDLSRADLILTAGHYQGPGQTIKPMHLRNISNSRKLNNPMGLFLNRGAKKLVFRLDGLRTNYAGGISNTDNLLLKNLAYADGIIFQSKYSKDCFNNFESSFPFETEIIHNGADPALFSPVSKPSDFSGGICLVSNSWSVNHNKGFETISAFSQLKDVSVSHIGRWPEDISPKKVTLLGDMNEKEIAIELRNHHFFLFPSENEACSNTVIEALSSGLPVLYHPSGVLLNNAGMTNSEFISL
jgi:glycosyltransferase involved in cell wall biosynthesis